MAGIIELANGVHDELLKLVAPASPASIEASSLEYRRNPILFRIYLLAFFFFVLFSLPIVIISFGEEYLKSPEVKDLLQIVGGAGLGSAFYSLYTASTYIKTSTFDPKYNNTYWVRFLIGVLSGVILAYFLRDIIHNAGGAPAAGEGGKTSPLYNIGVSALALIGGYAAEAVARVLDRMSETIVTLISGSDKDKIDSANQKAAADVQLKTAQANSDTVRKLQKALAEPNVPQAVQQVMDGLLK